MHQSLVTLKQQLYISKQMYYPNNFRVKWIKVYKHADFGKQSRGKDCVSILKGEGSADQAGCDFNLVFREVWLR